MKYGNPVREFLNINLPEEMAFAIEEIYIHNSVQLGIKTCNISTGGEASASGYRHTDIAKQRISDKLKGVKKSLETRLKMSNTNKAKVKDSKSSYLYNASSCNRKAVTQYSKDGLEVIKEYISIQEAYLFTGINFGNITSVCQGKLKSAGGYHWKGKLKFLISLVSLF
jgi:hypothetical protein